MSAETVCGIMRTFIVVVLLVVRVAAAGERDPSETRPVSELSDSAVELIDLAALAYMQDDLVETEGILRRLRAEEGERAYCLGVDGIQRQAMSHGSAVESIRWLQRAVLECPDNLLPGGSCVLTARTFPEMCDSVLPLCTGRTAAGDGRAIWLLAGATVGQICRGQFREEDVREAGRLWARMDFDEECPQCTAYEYNVARFFLHFNADQYDEAQRDLVRAARNLCSIDSTAEQWVRRYDQACASGRGGNVYWVLDKIQRHAALRLSAEEADCVGRIALQVSRKFGEREDSLSQTLARELKGIGERLLSRGPDQGRERKR